VKTYLVGGAVRDELLGHPHREKDYVVVGATPEEMVALGFRPVGKDFPVFLHPETHEEYALARTERKSGRGYKGFTVFASPDVTLEEDLRRRDLTINAIAKDANGRLIDPFGGKRDLEAGLLRHVSESFAEDPVRILRVARFAARFGFSVDEKTLELMRGMVDAGEADHLVPERVWQEFSRGLAEEHAERMFAVLKDCRLFEKLLFEIKAIPRKFLGSVPVRFAVLAWPMSEAEAREISDRLRAPNEVRELGLLAARLRQRFLSSEKPEELLDLLKRADAFRRPERFGELLEAARLAANVDAAPLQRALRAAAAVDAGAIAAKAGSTSEIPQLVDQARLQAIRAS
jgi:tRNA nucleotidyltransferase (CCA-adding enzyme)